MLVAYVGGEVAATEEAVLLVQFGYDGPRAVTAAVVHEENEAVVGHRAVGHEAHE